MINDFYIGPKRMPTRQSLGRNYGIYDALRPCDDDALRAIPSC